jgi:cobalt-zinc-cadmium efflux system membrane fusion protein
MTGWMWIGSRSGRPAVRAACAAVVLAVAAPATAGGPRESAVASSSRFRVADFERIGVVIATAGPGIVDAAIELPGEVRPNADRTAHLAPRFAGSVRDVRVEIGARVRAGDVLAVIESDTLARYEMRAPFDAVVVDKHIATGEAVDRNTAAFIVADLSIVWVEISVYAGDLDIVRPGRPVRITGAAAPDMPAADAVISYLSPIVDQQTRTAEARAVIANPDGVWRPGLFVTAHVADPHPAAVAIPRAALQQYEGRPVVFVARGDVFEPRRVRLGRVGQTTAEVRAGLVPGERYAAAHTFRIKAELERGEADEGDEPGGSR